MELGTNNIGVNPYQHAIEPRRSAAPIPNRDTNIPTTVSAQNSSNHHRVIDAQTVERVRYSADARELRPITIEDTRLNKVRPFLTVAQNGRSDSSIDLYI